MGSGQLYPMLVIDAGNTSVKFATVARAGASPRLVASVATQKLTAARLRALCGKARAQSTIASSVVPRVAKILRDGCPCLVLIGRRTKLTFATQVERRTVGADRLANMAEAVRRFGTSVLVVDCGTAVTFDLLDQHGHFAGGAIAPGVRALAAALAEKTAQLPVIEAKPPKTFAGRNTREALRAGVVGGYAGLVEHLVRQLPARHIVFTGGDAKLAATLTGTRAVIDPLWTLKGIAVLGALNAREASK
ncbi:MAG: type III pantothenate kinase [Chthoniobacterales bacterium]